MDHPTGHRYCFLKNILKQTLWTCMFHGIDAALGKCEVDGLRKIKGNCRWISKICKGLVMVNIGSKDYTVELLRLEVLDRGDFQIG